MNPAILKMMGIDPAKMAQTMEGFQQFGRAFQDMNAKIAAIQALQLEILDILQRKGPPDAG
jgi:hypothetical protein